MAGAADETGAGGEASRLMDAIYRHQRHIYDLTRKYYLLGRDLLVEELNPPTGGTVLELGCGTGRNLIVAARRYPGARFYGIDLSAEMLKTAHENIARAGLANRIRLALGDATDFDPSALCGEAAFDRVFISYSLSMIPPWRAALSAGLAATKPEGSVHIVDFGQQEGLPRWFRSLLVAWLAKFHVEPRADLEDAMRDAAQKAGGTLAFRRLYRDYARIGTIRLP